MQEPTQEQIEAAGPDVTPDCCPQWRVFAPLFQWGTFQDFPGLACMPHVADVAKNTLWRVNHCPACGADRRAVVMWTDDVAPPESSCPMQLVAHGAGRCKGEGGSKDE